MNYTNTDSSRLIFGNQKTKIVTHHWLIENLKFSWNIIMGFHRKQSLTYFVTFTYERSYFNHQNWQMTYFSYKYFNNCRRLEFIVFRYFNSTSDQLLQRCFHLRCSQHLGGQQRRKGKGGDPQHLAGQCLACIQYDILCVFGDEIRKPVVSLKYTVI